MKQDSAILMSPKIITIRCWDGRSQLERWKTRKVHVSLYPTVSLSCVISNAQRGQNGNLERRHTIMTPFVPKTKCSDGPELRRLGMLMNETVERPVFNNQSCLFISSAFFVQSQPALSPFFPLKTFCIASTDLDLSSAPIASLHISVTWPTISIVSLYGSLISYFFPSSFIASLPIITCYPLSGRIKELRLDCSLQKWLLYLQELICRPFHWLHHHQAWPLTLLTPSP